MIAWWWIPVSWVLLFMLVCTIGAIFAATKTVKENRRNAKILNKAQEDLRHL